MNKLYDIKEDEDIEFWDKWFHRTKKRIQNFDKNRITRGISLKEIEKRHGAYVYLVECEGCYKIGKAKNAGRRILDMQGGNPFNIKPIIISYFKDAFYVETQLHRCLRTRRIKHDHFTEWFFLSDNDLKNVVDIIKLGRVIGNRVSRSVSVSRGEHGESGED